MATRLTGPALLSTPFLCSSQEGPTDPWVPQALLYLREAVDMRGLPAAVEGWAQAVQGGPLCTGWGREEEACTDSQCSRFPAQGGQCSKNEQGRLGTQDPQGALTTYLPRPLTREREMARPPSWSLCSPLTGYYYPHGHPEQTVRTKVVTQGTPCVYRAHRAQTFCPSDL